MTVNDHCNQSMLKTKPVWKDCIRCGGKGMPGGCPACRQAPRWFYPGEIHRHMKVAHRLNTKARGWSRRQAELMHDYLHNKERGFVGADRAHKKKDAGLWELGKVAALMVGIPLAVWWLDKTK